MFVVFNSVLDFFPAQTYFGCIVCCNGPIFILPKPVKPHFILSVEVINLSFLIQKQRIYIPEYLKSKNDTC